MSGQGSAFSFVLYAYQSMDLEVDVGCGRGCVVAN